MSLTRFALALLTAAVLAFVAALPAGAKDGVKATLLLSIPLDAAPGTRVRVAWRLFSVDERGEKRPFSAGGLFVRLLSATGADPTEALASVGPVRTGEHEATVQVPEGGIRDVVIGLHGWTTGVTATRQSDVLFPITNDPVPRPPPLAAPSADALKRGDDDATTWVVVLVAVLLSTVVVGTAARRLAVKT